MKPARGSGRTSTQGPRGAADRNILIAGKSKNKGNWKLLTKSSLLALENMLGLSVLTVLSLKNKEKEESQKHLILSSVRASRYKINTVSNLEEMEDEEEESQEFQFLQLSEQMVQCLPALLSLPANKPMLQIVPNPPAVIKVLQMTPILEDVRTFLELAHKKVDAVQAAHNDCSAMD
uniref:Centromere protein Q n=1 Tax=Cyprinus carpio carpio TaxID=630221 RepID=A0A8C1AVW4_CYPCA